MKTREAKKQKRSSVILSEATDGINKVRLIGSARAEGEEEACPWEEIDAYSGRFAVGGYRYSVTGDISDNNHPWIAYSTDGGKTWARSETTAATDQPHGLLYALTYGAGRFVVAGYRYGTDNYHPWIAYSIDGGKTWKGSKTTTEASQPHGCLRALTYGGGRFVVAGFRYGTTGDNTNNYHPWLAYSTDGGETWIGSKTTTEAGQPHGQLHALTYGGGRFVVAGYRYGDDNYHPWLAYSTDGGETWIRSETTADESQPHGQLHALAYGGGRFVVAGYRYGTTGDDTNNYHPWIAYSTDGGKTWTKSVTTANESQPHGYLYALTYGGGRFVVAGFRYETNNYRPWIAYSTDGGETWIRSETTANEDQAHGFLYALTYGGGRFVVAGYRNETATGDTSDNYHPWLAYSTDGGKTWTKSETTAATSQPHGQLWALTYAPDSYCWKFGTENEETAEEAEEAS